MRDSGQDPREGIFPPLGLIVSWLLAKTNNITFHEHFFTRQAANIKQVGKQHKAS